MVAGVFSVPGAGGAGLRRLARTGEGQMKFVFQQFLPEPPEVVFAFFRNPGCLPLLHAKEKHIRVLRHGHDVKIGNETWAEVTMLGILPVILGFRHDLFEPPRRFGESLAHGVFEVFSHVHEFVERNGGTLVVDRIEIRLPWFYGGEAAVRWCVEAGLRRSFAARRLALERLVASGELRRRAAENLEIVEAL
jgi:ligand-binding SRPBCC domain-containing protein